MRLPALLLVVTLAATPVAAQQVPGPLLRPDSVLVYEVLAAEDRRDSIAPALAAGLTHRDPRVVAIARRARARLGDSTFASRTELGRPAADRPLPTWPEPEWAGRYRALGGREGPCGPLVAAFEDVAPQVQQRAITLSGMRAACAEHAGLADRLERFLMVDSEALRRREPGTASWQLASEALVALARVAPERARTRTAFFAAHEQAPLRRAAARAATITRDQAVLLQLIDDADGNVREAAVQGAASVMGRAADSRLQKSLGSEVPQVALAAASALVGATDSLTRRLAAAELARRDARNWASERDIRQALRRVLGQPTDEQWSLGQPDSLPWDVVGLALGERRYVEVQIAPEHGGGRFVVELRGDVAPIQAARVLAHARRGAYDGTSWHRVEPNFVIQGGSPHDNEYSGSGRFIVDELSTVPHPRGSVGMSTRGHSTGDLQWFVNLRDNARLTGAYTTFAVVVEGMDVVDDIMEGDRMRRVREVSASRPSRP